MAGIFNNRNGGDATLSAYLQRAMGYSLTGDIREEKLFFLYGTGGNGKGTFLNTIQAILGDYVLTAATETFTANAGNRHLTELARFQARGYHRASTEEGKELAEARVKAITGGDPITANYMVRKILHFSMPQFKLAISGNHKPSFRNIDNAIRRRFNLIPSDVHIDNPDLDTRRRRFQDEGLHSAMDGGGCLAWQDEGLNAPPSVEAATGGILRGGGHDRHGWSTLAW